MSAGAFSDSKLVDATSKVIPILVDCDWGKKNRDISDRYGVRGYPTVVFADPAGNEKQKLVGGRQASDYIREIDALAGK